MPAASVTARARTGSRSWKKLAQRSCAVSIRRFVGGFLSAGRYATRVCRAFNDYVAERYHKVDKRLHPMGLLAKQDVNAARKELGRFVIDLKLPGAMLPSRGLPFIWAMITTGRFMRKNL
jgi:hypothetical protein